MLAEVELCLGGRTSSDAPGPYTYRTGFRIGGSELVLLVIRAAFTMLKQTAASGWPRGRGRMRFSGFPCDHGNVIYCNYLMVLGLG